MEDKAELKKMNNKYMKGYYVYTKRSGKPGRYFRYKGEFPLSFYLAFYVSKLEGRTSDRIQVVKRNYKSMLPKTKRRKLLDDQLKKGVGKSRIANLFETNRNDVKKYNRKAFKDIVKDVKDLHLITSEENLKKMRKRMEFDITLYGNEGEILGNAKHIGKKTLLETVYQLNNTLKEGQYISPGSPNLVKMLQRLGFKFQHANREGFLSRVGISFTVRKG